MKTLQNESEKEIISDFYRCHKTNELEKELGFENYFKKNFGQNINFDSDSSLYTEEMNSDLNDLLFKPDFIEYDKHFTKK